MCRVPKYFTVEQANRTLPLVRRIVGDVVSTHRTLVERVEQCRCLDPDSPDLESERSRLTEEIDELTHTVNRFIGELHELGALFKGFDVGLVDFYAMLDGRPVFLCWELDEDQIEWWHELDGGFAGRQRLPAHLLSESS